MIDHCTLLVARALRTLADKRTLGQGMTEYGLILVFVAIIVIVAISVFATQTNALVGRSAASLN